MINLGMKYSDGDAAAATTTPIITTITITTDMYNNPSCIWTANIQSALLSVFLLSP